MKAIEPTGSQGSRRLLPPRARARIGGHRDGVIRLMAPEARSGAGFRRCYKLDKPFQIQANLARRRPDCVKTAVSLRRQRPKRLSAAPG